MTFVDIIACWALISRILYKKLDFLKLYGATKTPKLALESCVSY